MAELRVKRAGGAIAYASAIARAGTIGAVLERNLATEAAGRMPVIGPNAYGFINYLDGAALWLDHHGGKPCRRGVAIIGQSSNTLINMTMQRRGLPIAFVIALGNQASSRCGRSCRSPARRRLITAIGLHLEGISQRPPWPVPWNTRAIGESPRGSPQIGAQRSWSAARVVSHTQRSPAATTCSTPGCGVSVRPVSTRSAPSLETLVKVRTWCPARPQPGILELFRWRGGAGGRCRIFARHRPQPFDDDDVGRIAATTNPLVTIGNPFDYHTSLRLAQAGASRTNLRGDNVRGGHARSTRARHAAHRPLSRDHEWRAVLDAWIRAGDAAGKRIAVVSSLPEAMPEMLAESLVERGIVPLCGIETVSTRWQRRHSSAAMPDRRSSIAMTGNECDGPPSPADEGRPGCAVLTRPRPSG
ncbi:MAG: hypothetical protein R3D03_01515 [Geminicoccaceae bacterium]